MLRGNNSQSIRHCVVPSHPHCASNHLRIRTSLFLIPVMGLVWFMLQPVATAQQGNASPIQDQLELARRGDASAQLIVGRAYAQGLFARHNFQEAVKWFSSASSAGRPEAKAWLGSMYLFGRGVSQDVPRGAALIQEAAQGNSPVGLRFLGLMYQNGLGVTQSYTQADAYYASASRQGDAASFNLRAILYFQGWGVSRNPQMALEFLKQGASLGDAWAQLHLGELYSRVPPSQQGSVAHAQNPGLIAPSTEPFILNPGAKLQPDLPQAFSLFEGSARAGNRIAAYKAGTMLEGGVGIPQDYAKAFAYYRRSAADGYGPAQQALGRMYERGLGAPADLIKAYVHYSISQMLGSGVFSSPDTERVKKQLTPGDLARAEALVQASPARAMVTGNHASDVEVY